MEEQNKTLKQQSMRKGKKNELVLIDAERGIIAESEFPVDFDPYLPWLTAVGTVHLR